MDIPIPLTVLISANVGALLWNARMWLQHDRRLVRIETKLGLKPQNGDF